MSATFRWYCRRHLGVLLLILFVSTGGLVLPGCTPKVIVRKSPTDQDRGVRYYRPKPYLKIEPAEVAVNKTQSSLVPGLVRISLVYMPDFSEEYSISVRSGCGIADVGIKLEDGWNLTEISQELDSQTDENVEAIGSLLSAAGGLIPTSAADRSAENVSFTVPARNVPIGFYESVVGRDSCNVKRLYGFRYLGFMPFAGCPVEMNGHSHASCQDPSLCGQHPAGSLYGLTFVGGEMVFQSLDVMAVTPAVSAESLSEKQPTRSDVDAEHRSSGNEPDELKPPIATVDVSQLTLELRAYLTELGVDLTMLNAEAQDGVTLVRVVLPNASAVMPVRQAIDDWLVRRYSSREPFEVQLSIGAEG
ncbi:hypothetical protein [Neorhodopirellula pilleata]|uniref:Uncharacterized protein n=1 Tax=Neorhodopirellula pilleata TaxID=2714738 RepID=A0A5C5ZLM9_9BACT|nr:hypothetical protein [Neorhodopirellula pilleata]TWT88050.1 hypothetical protein Pla100_57810 [Neorhodopirellula pilleata]